MRQLPFRLSDFLGDSDRSRLDRVLRNLSRELDHERDVLLDRSAWFNKFKTLDEATLKVEIDRFADKYDINHLFYNDRGHPIGDLLNTAVKDAPTSIIHYIIAKGGNINGNSERGRLASPIESSIDALNLDNFLFLLNLKPRDDLDSLLKDAVLSCTTMIYPEKKPIKKQIIKELLKRGAYNDKLLSWEKPKIKALQLEIIKEDNLYALKGNRLISLADELYQKMATFVSNQHITTKEPDFDPGFDIDESLLTRIIANCEAKKSGIADLVSAMLLEGRITNLLPERYQEEGQEHALAAYMENRQLSAIDFYCKALEYRESRTVAEYCLWHLKTTTENPVILRRFGQISFSPPSFIKEAGVQPFAQERVENRVTTIPRALPSQKGFFAPSPVASGCVAGALPDTEERKEEETETDSLSILKK